MGARVGVAWVSRRGGGTFWWALGGGMVVGWCLVVATLGSVLGAIAIPASCSASSSGASVSARGRSEIPTRLLPMFLAAAQRYRLGSAGWAWLASINRQETDFGRNLSRSSAGAMGWMQFIPGTWSAYGVAVHHSGPPDPYDPTDAIFSAARYLRASGAPADWPRAVLAYNHAGWYVRQVAERARAYAGPSASDRQGNAVSGGAAPDSRGLSAPAGPRPGGASCSGAQLVGTVGYALPLQPRYLRQLGRTDDGVDIETAPDGALVFSITPGRCSAVGSDPHGFGPAYPVIRASAGSLAGQFVYYGHVARALVRAGEAVRAGQPIAVVGHTGDAAALGHGHVEIGFSTATGDPLSHHGGVASTPDGRRMRRFLIGLAAAAGIRVS